VTRRIRDLYKLLKAAAEPFGATVEIERTNGDHLRATFAIGTRRTFIITGLSPSDWRVNREVRANARRVLRSLAAPMGHAP
jgi:hypothetical protein